MRWTTCCWHHKSGCTEKHYRHDITGKCRHTSPALIGSSSTWALACHWSTTLQPLCMLPCHGRLSIPRYSGPAAGTRSQYSPDHRTLDPRCCTDTDVHQPLSPSNNKSTGQIQTENETWVSPKFSQILEDYDSARAKESSHQAMF